MPFNYQEFSAKCDKMTIEELNHEWNVYTRHISGGATSTAMSVTFAPITAGASLLGLGLSGPRIHNARKKRAIIEAHLQALGTTHDTRKRDVLGSMALSGTIGGLTLGLAPSADGVATMGAQHAIETFVVNPDLVATGAHAALDGIGAGAEQVMEKEKDHIKKKMAMRKLRKMASAQSMAPQVVTPPSFVGDEKKTSGITVTVVEGDMSDEDDMSVEEMEEILRNVMAAKRKS